MNTEGRVIHVFELIAHGKIEIAIDPNQGEVGAYSLAKAQQILEPRLETLEKQVLGIYDKYGIDDNQVNALRNAEAVSAYVVGILTGLDLAQRPDIVGKFAKMYADQAPCAIDLLFIGNASRNGQRAH